MNPQLTRWTGPEGLPRFDLIHDTDFAPAFDQALAAAEAANEAIAANPDAPDFANTIAAMETADEDLNRVLSVFYTLAGVDSNDARQALQRDFALERRQADAVAGEQKQVLQREDRVDPLK